MKRRLVHLKLSMWTDLDLKIHTVGFFVKLFLACNVPGPLLNASDTKITDWTLLGSLE